MKKKLELKKETVATLDGMGEVRGGGGTVIVSYQSNCNMCPTMDVFTQCNTRCTLCPTNADTCGNPTTTGCISDTCVHVSETLAAVCKSAGPLLCFKG